MIGFRKEQLALPSEARQSNGFNGLRNSLGKKRLVVFQGVSGGIWRSMQPTGSGIGWPSNDTRVRYS
jgi:hypothetical protein